ncbi:HAD family hydrolase [Leptothoe kymatousa]|uniref:HAD family hydrolase n=1 Tax=Leptothoe kymatousa TAU-MAC 1615 TaxID=2364775 RepID=A0ABS5Y4F9_9CYAN|nr:HAD family hydrolase [Leptothoe kymatousa]MBT9312388.1 HAD family hydrolase [Leptothoe kymatousa TAU-MAC 1615]
MVTISCNGTVFPHIKAVFLDKDGTLANVSSYLTRLGHHQAQLMDKQRPGCLPLLLQVLGISENGLDPAGLMAVGNRQETLIGAASAAAIGGCPWVEAMALASTTFAVADQRYSPKAAHTPLLPGALDLLQRLRQGNLKISMVSADAQVHLENFVEHHQLQKYFDHLQGVCPEYPDKVAPNFFQAACHGLGMEPHQVLVIGDAATDLQVATRAAGFIGYLGGWQPPLGPTKIASQQSLDELSIASAFATDFWQIQLTKL